MNKILAFGKYLAEKGWKPYGENVWENSDDDTASTETIYNDFLAAQQSYAVSGEVEAWDHEILYMPTHLISNALDMEKIRDKVKSFQEKGWQLVQILVEQRMMIFKRKSGYAAAPQKGNGIGFVKWLGENYDFNEFENKWGKFWEVDEGTNSGFDEIPIAELYNIFESKSPSPSEAGDGWVSVEDGLPEVDTPVYVRTEYKSSGNPMVDFFTAYMDEYGDTIICPHDESYGWQFNDCVTHWHPCIPAPPIQK